MAVNQLVPTVNDTDTKARVRRVLSEHGRLAADMAALTDASDLYQAGMTSHASVNVMLALESEFDVEFPDSMLTRGSFESIGAIAAAIEGLRGR